MVHPLSPPCQCSILWVFKATATQIREMSEQMLESLRIELGTSSTGLKETVVQMPKVNGVRWYEHVLRKDDGHVLRKSIGV